LYQNKLILANPIIRSDDFCINAIDIGTITIIDGNNGINADIIFFYLINRKN